MTFVTIILDMCTGSAHWGVTVKTMAHYSYESTFWCDAMIKTANLNAAR